MKQKPQIHKFTLNGLLHPVKKEPITAGLILARTSTTGVDFQPILESILGGCDAKKYDLIVAPEYSFFPRSGPLSEEELKAHLETLKKASGVGKTLLIPGTFIWQKDRFLFNTCFVLYNEKIIHQHDKMTDGGERKIAGRYGLSAQFGAKWGLFDWGELKVGVEICAENGLLGESRIRNLDLVVLSSCGLNAYSLRISRNAVKDYGFGIMVDGNIMDLEWNPYGQSFCNVEEQLPSRLRKVNYSIDEKKTFSRA